MVSLGNPGEKEWRGMIPKQVIRVLEKPLCVLGRSQDYSLFFQLRSSSLCTWFSKNVNSPAPSCLQARKYVDQIWLWGRLWKGWILLGTHGILCTLRPDLNRTKEKGNFSLGPTQHRKNSPPEQNSRALILTYIVEREDLTLGGRTSPGHK